MSKYSFGKDAITVGEILQRKARGEKISMVTCYDSSFAKLINATNIDMVLVGDSLGNVMLGYDDTIPVTVDDMVTYSGAVARTLRRAFLAVDMPFGSYKTSPEQALANAVRLVQEGGAQAVKLEGGSEVVPQVKKIVEAGIPVIGHLGLTPQSVHALSGYKVQGRGQSAEEKLLQDAKALYEAGAFCLVLELVPAALAAKITRSIPIATIGIGAGEQCDGQVLVLQDLLGFDAEFKPKFLKKYANMHKIVTEALMAFNDEVKSGSFPDASHSFRE